MTRNRDTGLPNQWIGLPRSIAAGGALRSDLSQRRPLPGRQLPEPSHHENSRSWSVLKPGKNKQPASAVESNAISM